MTLVLTLKDGTTRYIEAHPRAAEFDEAKHPRDEKGQWTSAPGDAAELTPESRAWIEQYAAEHDGKLPPLYHGTAESARAAIRKEGLVPGKGKGADEWLRRNADVADLALERDMADEHTPEDRAKGFLADSTLGQRPMSVFLSNDPNGAFMFAAYAATVNQAEPIVLEVKMPLGELKNLRPDELAPPGKAERHIGAIDPKYITLLLPNGQHRALTGDALTDDPTVTFYAVILCHPDGGVMKALGGPGSGNFGHAGGEGGPGNPGGSTTNGPVTDSPAFKRWFKDSKVVDSDGKPLVVYHGTTHDITEFAPAGSEKLNPEADWGSAAYFTNSPDDMSANYAGVGPDLTSRIQERADQIESERENADPAHANGGIGKTFVDGVWQESDQRKAAVAQATAELTGHAGGGFGIPVYLSMQNPFVLGRGSDPDQPVRETFLTHEWEYDDPTTSRPPGNPDDAQIIGAKGTLVDFTDALKSEARQFHDTEGVDEFIQSVQEHGMDGGLTASDLDKMFRESEKLSYITDDQGRLASHELYRLALEKVGFDGIIDRTVNQKFGSQRKIGQSMAGMTPGTVHYVIFKPTQAKSAIGNRRFDPKNPLITAGGPGSGNFGHEGRPGEVGGSGPGGEAPRTFTSEEGYQWHETGPVADWARALPYDDHRALGNYSSFGYHAVNDVLRGTPPMHEMPIRSMTNEEKKAYVLNQSLKPPEGGQYRFYLGAADDPSGWMVMKNVVNEPRVAEATQEAAKLNDLIANRGYVTTEPMTLGRAAYFPGVSFEDLKASEGTVREEKGFSSTMVGDAQGRLTSYVASGKYESIYNRYGSIKPHEDEVGSAVRVTIDIPAGTKVASIEASRRLEFEHPKIQDPSVFQHPEWVTGTLKPGDFTMRDYSQAPTVRDHRLADKGTRVESEVLLGSGARFRVVKVERDGEYNSGDHSLKPISIIDMHLAYVGGGSSEGKR